MKKIQDLTGQKFGKLTVLDVNARIKAEEKYFGEYRYRECTEETF